MRRRYASSDDEARAPMAKARRSEDEQDLPSALGYFRAARNRRYLRGVLHMLEALRGAHPGPLRAGGIPAPA